MIADSPSSKSVIPWKLDHVLLGTDSEGWLQS
jgi:hypothetical protein